MTFITFAKQQLRITQKVVMTKSKKNYNIFFFQMCRDANLSPFLENRHLNPKYVICVDPMSSTSYGPLTVPLIAAMQLSEEFAYPLQHRAYPT